MSAPTEMPGQNANWNRPHMRPVRWSNSLIQQTNFLGRLACIAFVFGSTISLSFAGFQDGGVRGSRGSFVGPVQRIGFTAPHDSVAFYNPYLSRYRGGTMGYPEYRGPIVAPNRETVGSRNGFVPSPASQIGTIRRQEAAPQTRDLNCQRSVKTSQE
jgi:hypothetical protein